METLFNLTIPIFVVIAIGWIAAKLDIVPEKVVGGLNAYVFNFGMPCLVVGTLARQPADQLVSPVFLLVWLAAGVMVFAFALLLAKLMFNDRWGALALTAQGSAIGNLGFIGLPLVLEAFGPAAAGPMSAALVVDLVILIPLSILILETQADSAASGTAKAVAAFKGALINPFLISIFVGLILSLSGIGLPGPVDRTVGFLGAAAAPTALFALGMSLAARHVEGDMGPVALMSVLKLAVHPVLVYVLMMMANVPTSIAAFGLVLAALPVAGNVFVIAQRYGTSVRRSSSAIVISTAIAVATVTAAIEFAKSMLN